MYSRKQHVTRLKSKIRRDLLPVYTFTAGLALSIALFSLTLDIIDPLDIDKSDVLSRVRRSANQTNLMNSTNSTTGHPLDEGSTFPYIGEYPTDIFSLRQLRQGAALLHTAGMIYMFIALAIVCDEFFVPSIEVLTEKLKLTEDVSGATFMAAGGSAPELFSSVAGVFISKNSVGISTIIGSAVFNILFVIGACALAARETLQLTWWPLFRDAIFYSISLIILILSFHDSKVYYYEALVLLACYAGYVTFMVFNSRIERRIKGACCKSNNPPSNDLIQTTVPSRPATASMFRSGLLQLMLHSIDPLAEGRIEDREQRLRALANSRKKSTTNGEVKKDQNGNGTTITNNEKTESRSAGSAHSNHTSMELLENTNNHLSRNNSETNSDLKPDNPTGRPHSTQSAWEVPIDGNTVENGVAASASPAEEEDDDQPLDISWPKTHRKRCSYIFLAPIIFPLWLTLPDPRRADRRRFYPITFIGSIIWIAFFSIMMVWWASVICVTIMMPVEVIGLSVLAAGTSVPDLLTSVIVARKGYGDMAISSSIGSNIFDITVGLPLPWFMSTMITVKTEPWINVSAEGLFCSVVMLFCMLLVVIISIAVFRWKMTKPMGVVYLVLYFVFLAVSILLVLDKIPCI